MYYKEHNTPTVLLPEMDTMRMIREIAERKGSALRDGMDKFYSDI